MATSQKISETGWFYHAPAKRRESSGEPVPIPYASQIPGLNDLPPDPTISDPQQVLVNDFDSDYVRMAKQGGRVDLLRMRTPQPPSDAPVPYPRVNWFYQDDIQMEDVENGATESVPHQPLLPDYMVHQGYDGPTAAPLGVTSPMHAAGKRCVHQKQQPTPFATDSHLPFNSPSDGEVARRGRGGASKPRPQHASQAAVTTPERAKAPAAELDRDRPRPKQMSLPDQAPPSMSMLLGHGYVREWQQARDDWYDKQQKVNDRFDAVTREREQAAAPTPGQMAAVPTPGQTAAAPTPGQTAAGKTERAVEGTREVFKLSKFKNVAARTDSHAPAALHLAKGAATVPAAV